MDTIGTDNPFSERQQRMLLALAAAIIPASDEYDVPAADDPTIAADILATAKRFHEPIAAALTMENDLANAKYGADFLDLNANDRAALVEGANTPGFFDDVDWEFDDARKAQLAGQRTLVSIVAQCYYRDDRVMRSLDMAPRSPFPQGFEVEEGDWNLLDPVRQRGKIYRDAG